MVGAEIHVDLDVVDAAQPDGEPRRVNIPEDLAPDELTPVKARELIDAPVAGDRVLGQNPETGRDIIVKDGRFGPYLEEVIPAEPEPEPAPEPVEGAPKKRVAKKKVEAPKPRRASIFKSMSPETIDLETALKLFSLPRTVGLDPETQAPITAQNGPYGPYLKKGTDSRSLQSEDQIFDITLEQALEWDFMIGELANHSAAA